jgi:hypothetical protein
MSHLTSGDVFRAHVRENKRRRPPRWVAWCARFRAPMPACRSKRRGPTMNPQGDIRRLSDSPSPSRRPWVAGPASPCSSAPPTRRGSVRSNSSRAASISGFGTCTAYKWEANRPRQRPTALAGHGRTVPARTHSAGAELSATIGHGSEGRGADGSHCATQPSPPAEIARLKHPNLDKPEFEWPTLFVRDSCEEDNARP